MSYQCQLCNTVVSPNHRQYRLVRETRKKHYPFRPKANPGFQTKNGEVLKPLRRSRKRIDRIDDPGGVGWEMVKELIVCSSCFEQAIEVPSA